MVLVVVTDFIFATRIKATGQNAGLELKITKDTDETLEHLANAERVIIDANHAGGDPIELIGKIKTRQPDIPVTVYLSHVQRELAASATQAGADAVLSRSAFTARLADVLAGSA
jgi:DNA-binding NarL/FixJ family response regulator